MTEEKTNNKNGNISCTDIGSRGGGSYRLTYRGNFLTKNPLFRGCEEVELGPNSSDPKKAHLGPLPHLGTVRWNEKITLFGF